jgi:hypothetical protein
MTMWVPPKRSHEEHEVEMTALRVMVVRRIECRLRPTADIHPELGIWFFRARCRPSSDVPVARKRSLTGRGVNTSPVVPCSARRPIVSGSALAAVVRDQVYRT